VAKRLRDEGLQLLLEGLSGREVADRLGVTMRTIQRWRRDAGLSAPSGSPHSEINPELVDEALRQIDEGKIDTEISSSLGIPTRTLRLIRDINNRPRSGGRWKDNELSAEEMNDIIDMLREGATLTQIHKKTGVSKKRIRDFRENEVREGNHLPEFKKGVVRRQKYTDEELIDLAFLNPGYGLKRFIEYLGVSDNFVLNLFLEFKEFTEGMEDPIATLNDPNYVSWVTRSEYLRVIGGTLPRGFSRKGASSGKTANLDSKNALVPVPPINFNWGDIARKER